MQATYVQVGAAIDCTPITDIAAGQVVVLGELIGIARTPISANQPGSLAIEGVFEFAKEANAGVVFSLGQLAFWDDAGKVAVASGEAGVNKLLGHVIGPAFDDDSVRVRLCPQTTSTTPAGSSSGVS